MDTTTYNDARPADGQDERERRRMEQERADLETLAQFGALTDRLCASHQISPGAATMIQIACKNLARLVPLLLDKEDY